MSDLKSYILDRLSEPSTWRGFVLIATACGVNIAPDMQAAIITVGVAVAGMIDAAKRG